MTGDVGTYSVGILGCGEIVSNMHLPTLLATSGVHVAWVTDVDVRKAERVAAAFGVRALGVPAAPTALPPADIVLIAIPYGVREPYYEQLRHRRNALYVEKPLARTVEEHRRYCAWFEHTQLAVGFQRRAWGAVETMQRVLRATPFGPVQKVRVEYGRPGQLTGSRYSSDLRLAGGGMLFEVGVHWIDLALTATGATGARLVGGRMIRQDGFDLHTDAVFTLERGQLEDVPFELLISGLVETRNAIEVHCEHATLRFSLGGGRLLSIERAGVPLDVELVGTPTPSPSTVFQLCHAMWRGLIESVSTGAPNWTSASSSLVTTEVIEAAYGLPS